MTTRTLPHTGEKRGTRLKYLTITGLMAAMITVMTAYICHIPTGINGGYIHFGDSIIYLAAALLPTPYALAAAAIGGGLADLLTSPIWAPATIIIKMLITIPFTNKSAKIITPRNVTACIIAYFISGFSYFVAEYLLFGTGAALIASMSGSLIQSGGSAVFFVIFGLALDRIHAKSRLINAV
ncbi:MAG: TIGR04002 family protein [Lachnospiraceae bacterium]|nr:TIGR04002 family protein [Lachnospiraceae bacterium]MDE7271663.1 TIGR04002 family protein [Lachnospiraceae bacterium]